MNTNENANTVINQNNSEIPESLQIPSEKKGIIFFIGLTLINFAAWLAIMPVLALVLPLQIQEIDPANKVTWLGILSSMGIFTGMIVAPLVGKLSDNTTSKLGRRRPWMLCGVIVTIISFFIMSRTNNMTILIIANIATAISCNLFAAIVSLLVPDQIPPEQRGTASGIVGISMPAAIIVGMIVCGSVLKTTEARYMFIAITMAIISIPTILLIKDKPLPKEYSSKINLGEVFKSFTFNPKKVPDFSFAWLSRLVMLFGYSLVSNYMLYYLQDVINYEQLFPGKTVAEGVATLQTYSTLITVIATILGGILSDKINRRKVFVVCASIIMAIALIAIGLIPSWTSLLIMNSVMGLGYGIYNSVDNALVTMCLPNQNERGKYMGIMNIANCGAQSLAPIIAVPVINMTHSYTLLYISGAVIVFLSVFFIKPIKSVQ